MKTVGLDAVKEILYELSEKPIAFQRVFVTITGSIHAGLFLSQACYWSKIKRNEDGWFWKTREQWQEETGMERDAQEKSRRECAKVGVIEEELRGVPAKLFFRVNFEKLIELLQQVGGNSTSVKLGVLEPEKQPKVSTITPTIKDTETTTETTAEITATYSFSEFRQIFSRRMGVSVSKSKPSVAKFEAVLKDLGGAELRARHIAWIEAARSRYRDKEEIKKWASKNFYDDVYDFEVEETKAGKEKDWRDTFPRL
jgi:hypothetical protein